jgi:F-type H+-transporting ATPase subunit b
MRRLATRWRLPLIAVSTVAAVALGALPAMAADAAAEPSPFPTPGREQIITSVTTLIIFGLLVAVLGKYAWGPILAGLKSREEKIRKDIADAETARQQAETTLRGYTAKMAAAEEQVRSLLGKAAADAEKIAQSLRIRAQQEAEEIKERATAEIESAKSQAVREIYEQTADLATTIASKIIRRTLNADDQKDLVKRSLEEIQTVGSPQ